MSTVKVGLSLLIFFILSAFAGGDLDIVLSWSVKLFFVVYCSLVIWTYLRPMMIPTSTSTSTSMSRSNGDED